MKTFCLFALGVTALALSVASTAQAAPEAAKVQRFANEITAAAQAIQNVDKNVNNQFAGTKKGINFLANKIRTDAAVISINAGRVNLTNVAQDFLARVKTEKNDAKNLEAQIKSLKGQGEAANDQATIDLAKEMLDLVKNLKKSINKLEDELD